MGTVTWEINIIKIEEIDKFKFKLLSLVFKKEIMKRYKNLDKKRLRRLNNIFVMLIYGVEFIYWEIL